jgi:hypothetical protein
MRLDRGLCPALAMAVCAACGPDAVTDPTTSLRPSPPDASASLVPLDPFGLGTRLPGSRGCDAAAYDQFDFWVAQWDVYGGPTTNLVGTNVVRSRLDGCVIEENWTSAFLGTGRSLNAFDASTGRWSQMWVASGGCPFSVLLIEGGFADGSMTMVGTREQPEGFIVGPPCGPTPPIVSFSRTDQVRWTPLSSGSVLQQFNASNNGDPLPPLPPPEELIGLRYDPVAEVSSLSPPTPSFCPSRAAAHQFDFMLGTWMVHEGNGEGAQGTASFTADQQQCLLEERFTGPGGYEGLSFNTFDVYTQAWVRTYVDNDGQRILMTGGLRDGAMVLTGSRKAAAGRSIEVRITWAPVAEDRVVQRWEYSQDGGASWKAGKEIVYTRS